MNDHVDDRATKWLVGDRLSSVLHIGDSSLAYRLVDQGHDVVVTGDDVATRRHSDVAFVRTRGDRLPFRSSSFDAVVVPHLQESAVALAEYARVLRHDGLLSTMTQRHDESIPWLRRLREIIGMRQLPDTTSVAVTASGLFHMPEQVESGTWERLDLDGLLRFAYANRHPSVPDSDMSRVRELFAEYGHQSGFLQLRRETRCIRARVDKTQMEPEVEGVNDIILLDFN